MWISKVTKVYSKPKKINYLLYFAKVDLPDPGAPRSSTRTLPWRVSLLWWVGDWGPGGAQDFGIVAEGLRGAWLMGLWFSQGTDCHGWLVKLQGSWATGVMNAGPWFWLTYGVNTGASMFQGDCKEPQGSWVKRLTLALAPPTAAFESVTAALGEVVCKNCCFLYTWKADGRPDAPRSNWGFGLSLGASATSCVKSTNDSCTLTLLSSQVLRWSSGEEAPEICPTWLPGGPLDPGCKLDWSSSGSTWFAMNGGGREVKGWLLHCSFCMVSVFSSWSTSRSSSPLRGSVDREHGGRGWSLESGSDLESDKSSGLSSAETVRSKPEFGDGPGAAPSAATESSKRESIAFSTKTQSVNTKKRRS